MFILRPLLVVMPACRHASRSERLDSGARVAAKPQCATKSKRSLLSDNQPYGMHYHVTAALRCRSAVQPSKQGLDRRTEQRSGPSLSVKPGSAIGFHEDG